MGTSEEECEPQNKKAHFAKCTETSSPIPSPGRETAARSPPVEAASPPLSPHPPESPRGPLSPKCLKSHYPPRSRPPHVVPRLPPQNARKPSLNGPRAGDSPNSMSNQKRKQTERSASSCSKSSLSPNKIMSAT